MGISFLMYSASNKHKLSLHLILSQ